MMESMKNGAFLFLLSCILLVACRPHEVTGAVTDTAPAYPFWGVTCGCGFDSLKEAAVLAEIRLDKTLIMTSPDCIGKVDVEYFGVVVRSLRGATIPGMRVAERMNADSTPYAVVNECLASGVACRYVVEHGGRKAYLYVPDSHEYTISAENGVQYHADVSYSPIFWGAEADAAIASLFPQST